jgi:hypothetical protein
MKIKKIFLSVFLLTFIIGYISVLPTEKCCVPIRIPNTIPTEILESQFEAKPDLETIEEVNSWAEKENYPFKIKLLENGDGYHGAEIDAKNGETWLGLFEEKGEFFLRSTKLKIKRVYDPIMGAEDYKKTGKSVEVTGKKTPLFLVKNAAFLAEGKISTVFKGVTWDEYYDNPETKDLPLEEVLTFIRKDFSQVYEIAGKQIELKVIEAKNKDGDKILALTLKSDGKRQILHTIYADGYPELGTLYWIGDLDRDGRPDFYLELFEHENVNNKVLFLSSPADKDKLVKKVAYFWTTGC